MEHEIRMEEVDFDGITLTEGPKIVTSLDFRDTDVEGKLLS